MGVPVCSPLLLFQKSRDRHISSLATTHIRKSMSGRIFVILTRTTACGRQMKWQGKSHQPRRTGWSAWGKREPLSPSRNTPLTGHIMNRRSGGTDYFYATGWSRQTSLPDMTGAVQNSPWPMYSTTKNAAFSWHDTKIYMVGSLIWPEIP